MLSQHTRQASASFHRIDNSRRPHHTAHLPHALPRTPPPPHTHVRSHIHSHVYHAYHTYHASVSSSSPTPHQSPVLMGPSGPYHGSPPCPMGPATAGRHKRPSGRSPASGPPSSLRPTAGAPLSPPRSVYHHHPQPPPPPPPPPPPLTPECPITQLPSHSSHHSSHHTAPITQLPSHSSHHSSHRSSHHRAPITGPNQVVIQMSNSTFLGETINQGVISSFTPVLVAVNFPEDLNSFHEFIQTLASRHLIECLQRFHTIEIDHTALDHRFARFPMVLSSSHPSHPSHILILPCRPTC